MNLRMLECFFTLSRELHFGRAAATLYMGQSSLSETIKGLEGRLGGALFTRSSRRVELTEFGRAALELLEPAYLEMLAALDSCRRMNSGEKVQLSIGFLGGGFYELHRPFVREFAEAFPQVELTLVELTYTSHFSALAEGDVDLALCRLPVGREGLVSGPILMQDQRVLCLPVDHPLAEEELIDPEELTDLQICRVPPDSTNQEWQEYHFPRITPAGKRIASGPTITTVREAITAVSAGEVCFMLTKRAVDYYRTPDVAFVDIDLPSMPTALLRRARDHRTILEQTDALLSKIAQRLGTAPVPALAYSPHPKTGWD